MRWRPVTTASVTTLVAALVAGLALVAPAAATPLPRPEAPRSQAPNVAAGGSADGITGNGTLAAYGVRWPGSTITVRTTLKGLKLTATKRAIRDWNTAGLAVKFKLVKSSSAQVVIKEAKRLPCDGAGCGTVGYQNGAKGYVTLSARLDPTEPPFDALWYARLVAHELGHILGLGHSGDPDALMYPYPRSLKINDVGKCRFRAKEDVRLATQIYGGKGSLALKTNCRFAKKVGAVPSVTATIAEDAVIVSWGKAKRAAGYTIRRGPAGGACPANPRAGVNIQEWHGRAEDYTVKEGKKYCYRVFPYNKEMFYNIKGAKSTVFTATTPRPAKPTAVTLTRNDADLDEGYVGFDVVGLSAESILWYAVSTGSQCTASEDEFYPISYTPGDTYPNIVIEATGATRCIAFRNGVADLNWEMVWSPTLEVRVTA